MESLTAVEKQTHMCVHISIDRCEQIRLIYTCTYVYVDINMFVRMEYPASHVHEESCVGHECWSVYLFIYTCLLECVDTDFHCIWLLFVRRLEICVRRSVCCGTLCHSHVSPLGETHTYTKACVDVSPKDVFTHVRLRATQRGLRMQSQSRREDLV